MYSNDGYNRLMANLFPSLSLLDSFSLFLSLSLHLSFDAALQKVAFDLKPS